MAAYKDDGRPWIDYIADYSGLDSGPETDVHVRCGLTMVGADGPVPCTCHRYCDPRWCMTAAYEAQDQDF